MVCCTTALGMPEPSTGRNGGRPFHCLALRSSSRTSMPLKASGENHYFLLGKSPFSFLCQAPALIQLASAEPTERMPNSSVTGAEARRIIKTIIDRIEADFMHKEVTLRHHG